MDQTPSPNFHWPSEFKGHTLELLYAREYTQGERAWERRLLITCCEQLIPVFKDSITILFEVCNHSRQTGVCTLYIDINVRDVYVAGILAP